MFLLTKVKKDLFIELYLEDELYKEVDLVLFRRKLPLPKTFSSIKEVDAWFEELEHKVAKSYLSFILGKRDYLSHQLEEKLKKRKFSLKTIKKLIPQFEKWGFIDDERFLSFLVNSYKKKKSIREIKFLLRSKGVDLENFPSISQLLSKDDEIAAIKKLIEKSRHKEQKKLIAYLIRKGFSYEIVKKCLDD